MRRPGSLLWRLWQCLSPALVETLVLLRDRGMRIAEFARAANMSYNAARRRLERLEACGLAVARHDAGYCIYEPTQAGAALARAVAAWLEARGGEARAHLRQLWQCLSPACTDILLVLAGGPAAAAGLARALGMHRSTVLRCLGRLKRCGLVGVAAREGARYTYTLTPEGAELAAALLMALSALEGRVPKAWS